MYLPYHTFLHGIYIRGRLGFLSSAALSSHGAADLARRALTARSGCTPRPFATAPSIAMGTDSSSASSTSSLTGSSSMPALGDASAPVIFSYATINMKYHVPIALDLKLLNFTK